VTQDYSHELGLLRKIVCGMEKRSISPIHADQKYLRDEHLACAHPFEDGVCVLHYSAGCAMDDLVTSLIKRSPGMERGSAYQSVYGELLGIMTSYLGRTKDSLDTAVVATIHANLEDWFKQHSKSRQFFLPCAISPWEAPRFSIGPVDFIYRTEIVRSEFYPSDSKPAQHTFDNMLIEMEKTRNCWLACVSIEGCDPDKGKEIAAFAVDLALAGLQLLLPQSWNTRYMSRLNGRRREATTHSISLSDGKYHCGSTVLDAGLQIGSGTLADILGRNEQWVHAIESCVSSFVAGKFRFPGLELAWCDAAFWLHEALAETSEAIAYTKLETALEVLTSAGSTSESQARIELILDAFYSLCVTDKLTPESKITAKQFAKEIVQKRSRILHGTWSTLLLSTKMNRVQMEQFTIEVIRRTVLELQEYAALATRKDDIESLLKWVKSKRQSAFIRE